MPDDRDPTPDDETTPRNPPNRRGRRSSKPPAPLDIPGLDEATSAKLALMLQLAEAGGGQRLSSRERGMIAVVVLFLSSGGAAASFAALSKWGQQVLDRPSAAVATELAEQRRMLQEHVAASQAMHDATERRLRDQDQKLDDIDNTAREALTIIELAHPVRRVGIPVPDPEPGDR